MYSISITQPNPGSVGNCSLSLSSCDECCDPVMSADTIHTDIGIHPVRFFFEDAERRNKADYQSLPHCPAHWGIACHTCARHCTGCHTSSPHRRLSDKFNSSLTLLFFGRMTCCFVTLMYSSTHCGHSLLFSLEEQDKAGPASHVQHVSDRGQQCPAPVREAYGHRRIKRYKDCDR